MTDDPGPDEDLRAAEYVLGTLRGAERRRFEAELRSNPVLGEQVAAWQERLSGLAGTVRPVAPPPDLWSRIEREVEPARRPGLLVRLWNDVLLWRIAAVSAMAATVLAVAVALQPVPQPVSRAGPALVAVLQEGTEPAFAIRIPEDERATVTPVGERTVPPGRSYELWAVPGQGTPVSLGLVAGSEVTLLPLDRMPADLLRPGVTLAVSLEPSGGSPSGGPTGPVLFAGTLVAAR
ncbi:anti-sigma factor [Arenibaculum sp.]|uniref:anti-sigma factor n=1 Tax=Arenibaculum sp. TaxID=2865862 RepID=UPI002E154A86|nr:anti-sigma factor [Arenibaculum sp.]